MNNNIGRMLLGTLLIAVGVITFGNIYEFWQLDLFFNGWWTLFLIVPGLISILQGGLNWGNMSLVLIGTLLLLGQQGIIDDDMVFKLIFPVVLIMLGLFTVFGSFSEKKTRSLLAGLHSGGTDSDDSPNCLAFFGANDVKNSSQNLQGGNATAIFGGVTLDLRGAKLTSDITFNTTAIFGGIEIIAPPNVRVRVTGLPVFGGNDVKVAAPTDENLPLITFNCLTLFGGTEIK